MLAIRKSEKSAPTSAVNVLPCRIQHNGAVHASTRHWTPEITSDGNHNSTATAYFRGRKLNGRVLNLPDGYRGTYLLSATLLRLLSSKDSKIQQTSSFILLYKKRKEKRRTNKIPFYRRYTPENRHHPSQHYNHHSTANSRPRRGTTPTRRFSTRNKTP